MAGKLKSFFANPIALRSLVKASIGTAVLAITALSGFQWFLCVCGILFALWLYLGVLDGKAVVASFFILIFSSIAGIAGIHIFTSFLPETLSFILWILTFFALLTCVIGIGNFAFEDRNDVYSIFHTVLLFVVFFAFSGPTLFISKLWIIVLFAAIAGLQVEFFDFTKIQLRKQAISLSVGIALFSAELLFILGFSPMGPVNIAAFLTLFVVICRDIMSLYFNKSLSKRAILREIAIFILFALAIFAVSGWSI